MTKEEFEANYIGNSDIEQDYYDKNFVTLPCECGISSCEGWACVSNDSMSIKAHNDSYVTSEK